MAFGIQERKVFVVECKRCRRDVPAGVKEFSFRSIVVTCSLPECLEGNEAPLLVYATIDDRPSRANDPVRQRCLPMGSHYGVTGSMR
jgi:hypothetical protein